MVGFGLDGAFAASAVDAKSKLKMRAISVCPARLAAAIAVTKRSGWVWAVGVLQTSDTSVACFVTHGCGVLTASAGHGSWDALAVFEISIPRACDGC